MLHDKIKYFEHKYNIDNSDMVKNNKVRRHDDDGNKADKADRIMIPKSDTKFKSRGADVDINQVISKLEDLDIDPRNFN